MADDYEQTATLIILGGVAAWMALAAMGAWTIARALRKAL